MATNKRGGTSQPSRSRKAPEKSASQAASRSPAESDCRSQACAVQDDDRLPVRDKVPGCSGEVPVLCRITYGGSIDPQRIEVALRSEGPFCIPLAGRPAEPNDLALDP